MSKQIEPPVGGGFAELSAEDLAAVSGGAPPVGGGGSGWKKRPPKPRSPNGNRPR